MKDVGSIIVHFFSLCKLICVARMVKMWVFLVCTGDKSARKPSGVWIGTSALITRGLREVEFVKVADFLDEGIQIAVKAKETCPGKDFQEYVESEVCQQHAAIVNSGQRAKAFVTHSVPRSRCWRGGSPSY